MRIIAGIKKGLKLNDFTGSDIKPITDRVKELIFSMLYGYIDDAICLDLFAGSGGLGLEALSRGAKSCDFIDSKKESINLLKLNIEKTGFKDANVIIKDSLDYLETIKNETKYDLIFIDPPYSSNYVKSSLNLIHKYDRINKNGLIIIEQDFKDAINSIDIDNFYIFKDKKYGRTRILILKR